MKKYSVLIIFLLSFGYASASHLMGGGISYEYLGEVSPGTFRYRVTLINYINCNDDSNIPDPENSVEVYIYEHDKNNPNANKAFYGSETLFLTSVDTVSPNLPDSCVLGTNICIKEARYIKEINLPVNFDGYHLYFDDFARNAAIVNLANPSSAGMAFHAFIPPSLINNNSPTFNVPIIPYICAMDTTSILNSATDPDGDQLIFSFAKPYNDGNNFGSVLNWPLDTVPFAGGYSKNQPFGSGGMAFLNAATGFSQYYIPNQGQYVVVVEIKEYRNNQLIGITRRDLQLLVTDCPANPEPELNENPDSNNVITEYTITEGENLCFDVAFSDPNGDSLYLTASGSVFDSSIVNPTATLPDVAGDSIVTSQFCWNTVCNQEGIYNFDVVVRDNGCPPKEGKRVFTINVLPFQGPDAISGPTAVCEQNTAAIYSVIDISNSTFEWIIIGGTQIAGDSTGTITVNWNNAGIGQVRVLETSEYGCIAEDTTVLNVLKNPLPPVTASAASDTICAFNATTLFAQNAQNYTWAFLSDPGNILSTEDTFIVSLDTTATFLLTGTDTNTCVNYDTVTVYVNPLPPVSAQVQPDTTCAGDFAVLTASGASTYWWAITSSPADTFAMGDTVNIAPDTTTSFILTGTDTNSCVNTDTIQLFVHPLPVTNPVMGDSFVCIGAAGLKYWIPNALPNSTFEWLVQKGNITAGQSTDTVLIDWVSAGNGQIGVIETSVYGCIAEDTPILNVTVNPLPPVTGYAAPDTICAFDATTLFAQNAQNYTWAFLSNPDSIISTADSFNITLDTTTAFLLTGTDTNACINYDTVIAYVNPLPPVAAQALPDTTCAGDSATLTASGANTYWWAVASAPADTFAIGDTVGTRLDTTTSFILIGTDANGCVNADTVQIFVHPLPITNAITGSPYVCPGVAGVRYWVQNAPANSTFEWIAQQGAISGGQGTDTAIVNWSSNIGPARVSAIETDSNGCVGDTVHYDLQIIVQYIPPPPSGNDTLCDRDKLNQTYEATANTTGSFYNWGISGGIILNGNGTYQVTVDWDTLGANAGAIWFVESSNTSDTVCTYPSDTLWVTINPNPVTSAISGEFSVCAFDTNATYSVTGGSGSVFEWNVQGGTIAAGDSSNTISVNWNAAGTYEISVVETNIFGCVGDTIRSNVVVNSLPATNANNWDLTICPPDNQNIIYTVTGMDSSGYQWVITNGAIASGQGTDSVTVNWAEHGTGIISVLETTNQGCTNKALTDTVRLDGLQLEMRVVSDNYEEDTDVEVSWDTLNGDYLNLPFYLFKKAEGASWQFLDTTFVKKYVDKGVPTSQNIYHYKIAAINLCADTVEATPHHTILLQGDNDENSKAVKLNWNPYTGWENGVQSYEVWRKLDNETDYIFYQNAETDTTITFNSGKDGFIHNYRILARNFSGEYQSWSNGLQLNFEHQVIIPNAFSPNEDGKNDTWIIDDIELYAPAIVQVYNRWGNLVYHSNDYNNDWDGTRNGEELPDATYYYIVKLSTGNDQEGSVTIIR